MVERAFKKLFLDAMVVQQGRLSDKHKSASKVYVSAYRILLYMCPHTASKVYVSAYLNTAIYVSAYRFAKYIGGLPDEHKSASDVCDVCDVC